MTRQLPVEGTSPRGRRLATNQVKESLHDLRLQLVRLNHQIGVRLDLREFDLDCLDLIARHGPISPNALARQAGVHPATVTGILDRLEGAGWVARERSASDRRAVVVRALRTRSPEVTRLYLGMNSALDQLCSGYTEGQLEMVADFLRRIIKAGEAATEELTSG